MDKETLRKLQQLELSMLCDFHDYCIQHNLKYSLYGGTALGAIRHGGFIPWDDDVDLFMVRSEYDKFLKIIQSCPMKGYTIDNSEFDSKCCINHTKIRKNGTLLVHYGEDENDGRCHGVWIDLFVLDKVPNRTIKRWKMNTVGAWRVLLSRGNENNSNENWKKHFVKSCIGIIPAELRIKAIRKANAVIAQYANEKNEYEWADMSAIAYFNVLFPSDLTSKYKYVSFEDKMFLIVDDYDTLLQTEYGDYMKLPPMEEQICKHNPRRVIL